MSLEGQWVVETLAVGGELVPTLSDGPVLTIDVADGQVSGSAGVNRFSGRLGSDKPFPLLAVTKIAGPEELMAQEDIFLRHLDSVDTVEIADSGILLLSDGLVVVTLSSTGTN